MRLEEINKYGLLYSLQGSDTHLKPILFMAHQDVVPVPDPAKWTYPPFSATYDGHYLWGRGSVDCKNNLVGLLSTLESLLEQDFEPRRMIILSFGFDEETGGERGAKYLSQHIERKLGKNSLAMVHDEGGMGINILGDVVYALPAVAEKGFIDVILTLDTSGGHSSRPPAHTAIGIMSELVLTLENHPYTPILDEQNPFRKYLECEAKYSPDEVEPWLRKELASGKNIGPKIVRISKCRTSFETSCAYAFRFQADSRGDEARWSIQTSQAVDVIHGGNKDNALPEAVQVKLIESCHTMTTMEC